MSGPAGRHDRPADQAAGVGQPRASRKSSRPRSSPPAHAIIGSAWELAQNAFRLRVEAVSANNIDTAQRASSAAAGALMLYQRARADQLTVMEPPAGK